MYRTLKRWGAVEKNTMYLEKFDFLQWVSHAFFLLQPVSISKKDLDPLIVIPEKNDNQIIGKHPTNDHFPFGRMNH